MKFLSPDVALFLYKSAIGPFIEYCFHVWAGAPSCLLEVLDKLQKRIFRTVGPSLATSVQPLFHRRNVASLSLFHFHFEILEEGLLVILIDGMILLLPFLDVRRMSMSKFLSSHSWTLKLPACRMLSFDL